MEREDFIALLQKSSPEELHKYLSRHGKRKKIDPLVFFEEIPPDNTIDINIDKKKVITAKADDIKEIKNTPTE